MVAADGLLSRLRRGAGLDGPPARRRRFGVRRHFRRAPWADEVEVWWADGCEAYVTPAGAEEVGVAILWSPDERGGEADAAASGGRAGCGGAPSPESGGRAFDALFARFPRLAARLAGAEATSRDRGAGPFHQRVRAVRRGNLVLLGDAARLSRRDHRRGSLARLPPGRGAGRGGGASATSTATRAPTGGSAGSPTPSPACSWRSSAGPPSAAE